MSKNPPTTPGLSDDLDTLAKYLDILARNHPTLEAIAAQRLADKIRRDIQSPRR